MGRIIVAVDVENISQSRQKIKLEALVDTGASHLVLPRAWREKFGNFETEETIKLQIATQRVVSGTVCGPVKIKVEGFRTIHSEILFIDMKADKEGSYKPLLGYIVLEQCGAVIDMQKHCLLPVQYMDLR